MAISALRILAALGSVVAAYIGICIALLPLLYMQPETATSSGLDENVNIVADFRPSRCATNSETGDCSSSTSAFFFGLASAPAHVEDDLNDTWLDFARSGRDYSPVRAWRNIPIPEQRLRFWTEPEIDLDLAKEAGSTVFRLGIDWGRLVPLEPLNGTDKVLDKDAVEHYKRILQAIHDRGMRIMLTLFHHSIPKWALTYGGWTQRKTIAYFADFTRVAQKEFGEYVDYWITFNEPHIFVILTHCSMTWPPGGKPSISDSLWCFTPFGDYGIAMDAISEAHKRAYEVLHDGDSQAYVGVAHHVGVINPYGLLDIPVVMFSRWLTEFQWIDEIQYHLDFCGINYYGQEILSSAGLMLVPDEEYSEAGRGVYPDGLYNVLVSFHKRYVRNRPDLRYIITENGFADENDVVRRPYLLEHLIAVSEARKKGIPVDGYMQWTISDNWEWADGYCPKFGLVGVNRSDDLARFPRPSFYLYRKVSTSGLILASQREEEWNSLRAEVNNGGHRPFCRLADNHGRMWAEGLDEPDYRLIADKDWRFGKYTYPGFLQYFLRSVQVIRILIEDGFYWMLGLSRKKVSFPPELASGEL